MLVYVALYVLLLFQRGYVVPYDYFISQKCMRMHIRTLLLVYKVYTVIYIRMYVSLYVGVPGMVPGVAVDGNTININGNNVILTLSWGEPFNNLDPIVNYTVSCSGDDTCPPIFTTTDNTIRSYIITNLTSMTNYTFSVVATNSIGSGEAGLVNITIPGTFINSTATSSMGMTTMSSMSMTSSMDANSTTSIITTIPTTTPTTTTSTTTSNVDIISSDNNVPTTVIITTTIPTANATASSMIYRCIWHV